MDIIKYDRRQSGFHHSNLPLPCVNFHIKGIYLILKGGGFRAQKCGFRAQ